jgi:ribosomal protein L35AE/L33A
MRSNTVRLSTRTAIAVVTAVPVLAATPAAASTAFAANNHHCRNEQPLYASKSVLIARETTESSDIFVTCWRKTNKHHVVVKFPAEDRQEVAFRIRGAWIVWRYRRTATQRDYMGSINGRTGRRGPAVTVPTSDGLALLPMIGGPAAQDVGDASAMRVFIASNGYYAWPVVGQLPDDEGGQTATALYAATGRGGDARLDVGAGPDALRKITISGTTLRWTNKGTVKHRHLGPARR